MKVLKAIKTSLYAMCFAGFVLAMITGGASATISTILCLPAAIIETLKQLAKMGQNKK